MPWTLAGRPALRADQRGAGKAGVRPAAVSVSQREPGEPPIARASAEDLEAVRVVERHFHAEQARRFVVHLDRVLIEPMADADPFGAMHQRTVRLALKAPGDDPAEEAQDVAGREVLDRVMKHPGIERLEIGGGVEDRIGGPLAFAHAPVVAAEQLADPGIDAGGVPGEPGLPPKRVQPLADRRGLRHVPGDHGIVVLLVGNPGRGELSRQPFTPVHIHLHGQGQPGLYPNVHQPEVPVHVVEVQKHTAALFTDDAQAFGGAIAPYRERHAGFDTGEDADQALGDRIAREDLAGTRIL
jgi:hypothetical protein